MTDAEKLYDALDRLAYQVWEDKPVEHRWSPLGAAIWLLHDLKKYSTDRCIMTTESEQPGG